MQVDGALALAGYEAPCQRADLASVIARCCVAVRNLIAGFSEHLRKVGAFAAIGRVCRDDPVIAVAARYAAPAGSPETKPVRKDLQLSSATHCQPCQKNCQSMALGWQLSSWIS